MLLKLNPFVSVYLVTQFAPKDTHLIYSPAGFAYFFCTWDTYKPSFFLFSTQDNWILIEKDFLLEEAGRIMRPNIFKAEYTLSFLYLFKALFNNN